MSQVYVIKVGGALLESAEHLTAFFGVLKQIQAQQCKVVLVHGGGAMVEQQLSMMNLVSTKKDGLRVTPQDQIPFVTGALAGTANKTLMAAAIAEQLSVCGLSLADGNLCECSQVDPELGAVGKAIANDASLLNQLLQTDLLPIVSSIGISAEGALLNINADQAAVAIASLVNAELILLSDVVGVLDQDKQLLPELNQTLIEQLANSEVIRDGMLVKVNAALEAAEMIQKPVTIGGWKQPELLLGLATNDGFGTRIQPSSYVS